MTKKIYGEIYNIKTTWACGNSWVTQSLIPVPDNKSDIGCGECNYCKQRGRIMPTKFKDHFIKFVYHPTIHDVTHEYTNLIELCVDGVELVCEDVESIFEKVVANINHSIFSTYGLYTVEAKVKIGIDESLSTCKGILIKSLKVFTSDVECENITTNRVCVYNSKGMKCAKSM